MILLDTHMWLWWTSGDARLSSTCEKCIAFALRGNGWFGEELGLEFGFRAV